MEEKYNKQLKQGLIKRIKNKIHHGLATSFSVSLPSSWKL